MTPSSPYLRRMLAIDLASAAVSAQIHNRQSQDAGMAAAIEAVDALLIARCVDVPDNREETTEGFVRRPV